MNTVIARLVMRALPGPGGIRPRVGSRFEGSGSPLSGGEQNLPSSALAPAPVGMMAEDKPLRHPETARNWSESTQAPLVHGGFTTPAAGKWTEPPDGEAITERSSASNHGVSTPDRTVSAFDHSESVSAASIAPRQFQRGEELRPDVAQQLLPGRAHLSAAPGILETAANIEHTVALQEADAATLQSGLLLPLQPLAKSQAGYGAAPTMSDQRENLAPDVFISIGRIEILAEQPKAQTRQSTRPPRQRPKLMSLDDYLAKGRPAR